MRTDDLRAMSKTTAKESSFLSTATGSPKRNRLTPFSHGGRGLKQRRSGLLRSRRPSKGRHRRGLSILASRAERVLPLQSKAASSYVPLGDAPGTYVLQT
jgi:hypothetical protein